MSWRGHRPAHYSSYGLATDVVFDDRPDLAARPPPAPPLDQLFPVMVGKHGEYLGNAPEPLSSSRWIPGFVRVGGLGFAGVRTGMGVG